MAYLTARARSGRVNTLADLYERATLLITVGVTIGLLVALLNQPITNPLPTHYQPCHQPTTNPATNPLPTHYQPPQLDSFFDDLDDDDLPF